MTEIFFAPSFIIRNDIMRRKNFLYPLHDDSIGQVQDGVNLFHSYSTSQQPASGLTTEKKFFL